MNQKKIWQADFLTKHPYFYLKFEIKNLRYNQLWFKCLKIFFIVLRYKCNEIFGANFNCCFSNSFLKDYSTIYLLLSEWYISFHSKLFDFQFTNWIIDSAAFSEGKYADIVVKWILFILLYSFIISVLWIFALSIILLNLKLLSSNIWSLAL